MPPGGCSTGSGGELSDGAVRADPQCRPLWASALQNLGAVPPSAPMTVAVAAQADFRRMLAPCVELDGTARTGPAYPLLLVGAVDVLFGPISRPSTAASSPSRRHDPRFGCDPHALPLRAPSTASPTGTGLFSQNPPVRELVDSQPDELWVIQINPRRMTAEPRTVRSRSPTAATSWPATSPCTRSCASSRRSTDCSTRARSRPDGPYRPIVVRVIEFLPRAPARPARERRRSSTAIPRSSRS